MLIRTGVTTRRLCMFRYDDFRARVRARVRVRVGAKVRARAKVKAGVRARARASARARVRVRARTAAGVRARVRAGARASASARARARVRARVGTIFELGLTVFVTSRRYRQTNPAQALKETNRFTRPIPRIQTHTQVCHDATTSMYLSINDKFVGTA